MKKEQYKYEINAWQRTLDYLQQENIFMKTRVADVIKSHVTSAILDKVEYYQNAFLAQDTIITFLRGDIRMLQQDIIVNGEADKRARTLRRDMEKMEKEFNLLKAEFNNYMREVLEYPKSN